MCISSYACHRHNLGSALSPILISSKYSELIDFMHFHAEKRTLKSIPHSKQKIQLMYYLKIQLFAAVQCYPPLVKKTRGNCSLLIVKICKVWLFQRRQSRWAVWPGAAWSCLVISLRPWMTTQWDWFSGSRMIPRNQFTLMTQEVQSNFKSYFKHSRFKVHARSFDSVDLVLFKLSS